MMRKTAHSTTVKIRFMYTLTKTGLSQKPNISGYQIKPLTYEMKRTLQNYPNHPERNFKHLSRKNQWSNKTFKNKTKKENPILDTKLGVIKTQEFHHSCVM